MIFDEKTTEAMNNAGGNYLKGSDFEDGLTLQIVSVEHVASQFGAEEDNWFVEHEILKAGETFRYTFKDAEGNEKHFDSHSRPFAIGFQKAEVNLGDWVHVKRTGAAKNTRYEVTPTEAPTNVEDINPFNEHHS